MCVMECSEKTLEGLQEIFSVGGAYGFLGNWTYLSKHYTRPEIRNKIVGRQHSSHSTQILKLGVM